MDSPRIRRASSSLVSRSKPHTSDQSLASPKTSVMRFCTTTLNSSSGGVAVSPTTTTPEPLACDPTASSTAMVSRDSPMPWTRESPSAGTAGVASLSSSGCSKPLGRSGCWRAFGCAEVEDVLCVEET
ncbi:hypothetical protein C8Q80DRAFT_244719 [Daedaleopsis nitida]|nr:hypothetical protein C8Q80DRAFT_244719 [Daedaleopsis nitida]